MIKVEIAEIEQLTDVLSKAASDSDEVLSRLRQINTEMHDDLELPNYPQAPMLMDSVTYAIDTLTRSNDTLQSLRNVMFSVAADYREQEQRHKEALGRLTSVMDGVGTTYHAAVTSDSISHLEHSEEVNTQNDVQQLVAGSIEEMQATNIAAVSRMVREEYEVSQTRDLPEDN